MQIKPAFIAYKELWRKPLLTDSRGKSYSLVCFTGKRIYGMTKVKRREYQVLCDELERFSNGATAYSRTAYFDIKSGQLPTHADLRNNRNIRGFEIYPLLAGTNAFFKNGINIDFKVVKLWPWTPWWRENISNKKLLFRIIYTLLPKKLATKVILKWL